MKLKYPTVGPILGETTHEYARMLIRGELEWSDQKPRRSHGIIRYKKSSEAEFNHPKYFKLNPNFDMTGIAILHQLEGDTQYDYQIGWVFSDVDSSEIDVARVLDWSEAAQGQFSTGTIDRQQSRSVIAGSCRYMLKLFGGAWFDDRGDKTFRSIQVLMNQGKSPVHQLIMVGDQIYADDLNFVAADKTPDDYLKRYRNVFTQPYIRAVMSQIPTYMTLDDHEIEDNWPQSSSAADFVTKFPAAMHAYQTYQLSHSPCLPIVENKLYGTPSHLWYTYRDGCLDVFAMDTRTERRLNTDPHQIVSDIQFNALKQWLSDGSHAIKLILSSVPIVGSESRDKWAGFPEQRLALLQFITDNEIEKVVFLSGDLHASWSCEFTLEGSNTTKMLSIVSSAFFWPYPVASADSFQRSGTVELGQGKKVRLSNASEICRDDNFSRIDFSTDQAIVSIYGRKGERFSRKVHKF